MVLSMILPLCGSVGPRRARLIGLSAPFLLVAHMAQAAPAPDPTGEWRVEKGYATIRIVDCNGEFWGVVASEQTPGVDKNNPDPKLRSRPTLGMPVLLGMRPSRPNEWSGQIYNSQDGRTYSASISLRSGDVLKVQGCVLGFLCGGESWTRVPTETTAGTSAPQKPTGANTRTPAAPRSRTAGSGAPAPAAQPPSPQTQPAEEICSALVDLPGSTHERRLK